MPKSKLTAVLSLLFVFLSGAIAGALAQRAYVKAHPVAGASAQRHPGPADWRQQYVATRRERLKLDDKQTAQLTKLLNGVDDEMQQLRLKRRAEDVASPLGQERRAENKAIQSRLSKRIDEILSPEQRSLYQQLLDENEKAARQREQQMQNGKGPGGPPPGR